MINNTVSRTCVAVRSLDGGQHITDLTSVTAIVRPRGEIPFGLCEPPVEGVNGYGCGLPVMGRTLTVPVVPGAPNPNWLYYAAHDFNEDKTRICFQWNNLLWAKPPGRYMATVYLCGVAIGCFQMQVGKRFVAEDPINVAFNLCEAAAAICAPTVVVCAPLPAASTIYSLGWYELVNTAGGSLNSVNAGSALTYSPQAQFYGGVPEGVSESHVLALVTEWVPSAWAEGALAVQVAPTVTVSSFGIIIVTPKPMSSVPSNTGSNINVLSHGVFRIRLSVNGVLARNRLTLSVFSSEFSGVVIAWSNDSMQSALPPPPPILITPPLL